MARLADGWCPNFEPDDAGKRLQEKVGRYMTDYGRDPASLGLDGRLKTAGRSPEDWVEELQAWRDMGAGYVSVENRRGGLTTANDHVEAMRAVQRGGGVLAGRPFRVRSPSVPHVFQ